MVAENNLQPNRVRDKGYSTGNGLIHRGPLDRAENLLQKLNLGAASLFEEFTGIVQETEVATIDLD